MMRHWCFMGVEGEKVSRKIPHRFAFDGTELKWCNYGKHWVSLCSINVLKGGWSGYCKNCMKIYDKSRPKSKYNKEYQKQYYKEHLSYFKQYYQDNKEKMKVQTKQWQEKHPEKNAEYCRREYVKNKERHARYNEEHREAINAKRRERYAKNPGPWLERAKRKRKIERDARQVIFGDVCYLCGKPGEAIDHIKPLAKGGTGSFANKASICNSCNSEKSDK